MGGRRVSNFACNPLTMSYLQPPIYTYYTNDAEFLNVSLRLSICYKINFDRFWLILLF